MAKKQDGLTADKAAVYKVIFYMVVQGTIVLVLLGCVIWTLRELFKAPSEDKWI